MLIASKRTLVIIEHCTCCCSSALHLDAKGTEFLATFGKGNTTDALNLEYHGTRHWTKIVFSSKANARGGELFHGTSGRILQNPENQLLLNDLGVLRTLKIALEFLDKVNCSKPLRI